MELGTLDVTASHSPLAFWLPLVKVSIAIDGKIGERRWGIHSFQVPPGEHVIRIFYWAPIYGRASENSITVTIVADEVVRIHYRAGPWRFVAGKIAVERLPVARIVNRRP